MRAGQAANSGWPDSKCSVPGAHMALLSFDAAKVRRFHCGGRIFRGLFFDFLPIFFAWSCGHDGHGQNIIYNIYIFIYYSIKMALPKIDFDQNDHDHFDHDTGAVQPHRNLDSGEKCVTWCQARCYMGEITRAQICALVKNLLSAEWMVMEGQAPLCCNATHSQGVFSVCLCVILSVCCDKVA